MAERIVGIDFGTSTSVIRVKRYQDGVPIGDTAHFDSVTFNMGNTMVPTLIQESQGTRFYGYDAQVNRKKMVMYQNFKIELESDDEEKKQQARKLTTEFFSYLAKSYNEQSESGHLGKADDKVKTLVSYPVKWSEETKKFMVETAKKVGFPNVEGVDEAQAAISAVLVQNREYLEKHGYLNDSESVNILLIDMGAGTTDLVLSKYYIKQEKTEIVCTWPLSGDILFGGREVDEILRNHIKECLPEQESEFILKRVGIDKFKTWKETMISSALKANDKVEFFSELNLVLEAFEFDDVDYCIDREIFENKASEYICKFSQLINGCIGQGKMNADDIDLIILTGGHSQWYFVNEILSGKSKQFGDVALKKIDEDNNRIIPIVRPQETVALGLVYSKLSKKPVVVTPVPEPVPEDEEKFVVKKANNKEKLGTYTTVIPQGEKFCEGDVLDVLRGGQKLGRIKVLSIISEGASVKEAYAGQQVTFGIRDKLFDILVGDVLEKIKDDEPLPPENPTVPKLQKGDFIIDDVFVLDGKNRKAVLTAVPDNTTIKVGDTVYFCRDSYKIATSTVRGIAIGRNNVQSAKSGDEVGLLFEDFTTEIKKGDVLVVAKKAPPVKDADTIKENEPQVTDTSEEEFEIDSINGCYRIVKYRGSGSHVVIPSEIRGRKVIAIGKRAFNKVSPWLVNPNTPLGAIAGSGLVSVVIPDTVAIIEDQAFFNCRKLEKITMSKNIEKLGLAAFSNCRSLKSIDLGCCLKEVPMNAFSYCQNLESVKFPDCIQKINAGAFAGCNELKNLTFGSEKSDSDMVLFPIGLKEIGANAFSKINYSSNMYNDCIFKDVMLSKKTKVKEQILNPKTFKNCAVFYYED